MKNFFRALWLTFRYRGTMAAAIFSALAVAVLWGGNITAIYPIVGAVFEGKSLPQWIETEIDDSQGDITRLNDEIAELNSQAADAPTDERAELQRAAERKTHLIAAEQQSIDRWNWVLPYAQRYMPTTAFRTLLLILAVLMAGTLLKDVFIIANSILAERLAQLATLDLRQQFYRHALRMDVAQFSEQGRGDMMNRFTGDMQHITTGIRTLIGRTIREPFKMVACLAGAAFVCWRLLILSLIIAPVAGYLIDRLGKSIRRANRRAMEDMSTIYNTLMETFSGIKVVKAFTMEAYERRRFLQNARQYFHRSMKIARYDALVHPLTEMMGMVIVIMAVLAGGYLSLTQETHLLGVRISNTPLSLADLFLFFGLLAGVSDPARKLSDVFGGLQKAAAASDRVYQLLDEEPKVADPLHAKPLPRHRRELALEKVSFGYDPDRLVLEEINLRIPFGETIALVGANGCGKTTLANLVPRFFDPNEGAVKLDGVDLRESRLRDLRRQIGMVTQETLLFDDTIYNNIRYGMPHATSEEIYDAARRAHADRFVETKLAKGYDTTVGPGGQRLSGGQRQRIALARAILRDPPILILDEATSQIDLESEQLIHQVLTEFIRHRTTLIVTHRVSTLTLADRIVVMEHGRIIDQGTHDELAGRCDFYSRFFQLGMRESA